MARFLPGLTYLAAVAAWLVYCAVHTFYIGRMPLPLPQALVLGAAFAVVVSLVSAWVLMGLRLLKARFGVVPRSSFFDHKAIRIGLLAMLGMLSLIGMMIRNKVILIGEIDQWIARGTDRYQAVVQASLTRVRPVLITACTTTLGMIPLVNDNLFGSMAVTIMGGLMFATILTLVFIPTLYVIFFRIRVSGKEP